MLLKRLRVQLAPVKQDRMTRLKVLMEPVWHDHVTVLRPLTRWQTQTEQAVIHFERVVNLLIDVLSVGSLRAKNHYCARASFDVVLVDLPTNVFGILALDFPVE